MPGIQFKKQVVPLLVLALGIAFNACKKDVDEEYPSVRILIPNENAYFPVPDTITVGVAVSDDKALEYVKAFVANENYIPVAPVVFRYPQNTDDTLYIPVIVDDVALEGGDYYVIVTASDGVHEKFDYRKIKLYETPRRFKGVLFAVPKTGNMVELYKIDTFYNTQLLASYQGDFRQGTVNSVNQAYYSTGDVYGGLFSINASTGGINWSEASNGLPPQTYWTGISTYSNRVYVSSSDGKIQGFSKSGSKAFSTTTDYVPHALYRHEDLLFCEERHVTGNLKRLVSYTESTGAFAAQANMNMEVVGFASRDYNNVMLFGNEGDQGVTYNFSISLNGFWEPHTLPQGKILSVAQVDETNYLIAHEAGIYWYRYNPNSLVQIISLQVNNIRYNEVNSIIVSSSGTEVFYHSFPGGSLLQTVSHSDTIRGMDLLFNK